MITFARKGIPLAAACLCFSFVKAYAGGALGWGTDSPLFSMTKGDKVWVANAESNDVAVIDMATNKIVKRIPVGARPHMAMVSPDGKYVLVSGTDDDTLQIIDVEKLAVVKRLAVGRSPEHVNISPDGKYAFLVNHESHEVSVIEMGSFKEVARIPVGIEPENVTFNADATKAYVAGFGSYEVTVIDISSLKAIASVSIGGGPQLASMQPIGTTSGPEIATIHPSLPKAYVPNEDTNDVSVVDLNTLEVQKSLSVGKKPTHTTLSPDGKWLYVVNSSGASVSAISTETDEVAAKLIMVGDDPQGILFSPDSRWAFVVNKGSNSISVINVEKHDVAGTIKVGSSPEVAALTPDGARLYVANSGSNDVTVVDVTNPLKWKIVTNITGVGRFPWSVDIAGGVSYCH